MRLGLVLLAAGAALVPAATASAATLAVTQAADADGACDANCALREAIIAANATAEADLITIPSGMVATISITGTGEDATATGDLDVVAAGGALEIRGAATLDGGALDRVFHVLPGASLTLTDLTVSNGSGSGSGVLVGQSGSAAASLTVTGGNFSGHVNNGAAIEAAGQASLQVTGTSFLDNGATIDTPADSFAPVIYARDTSMTSITGATFARNKAGFGGGGVFNEDSSTMTIDDSTFTGNVADFGGGAIANQNNAKLTITDSTLTGNSAGFGGGAIFNQNDAQLTAARLTITGNTVSDFAGGAIFNQNAAKLTLSDSTVSGNQALDGAYAGGAFFLQNSAQTTITNTTIADNTATTTLGGGAFFIQNDSVTTITASTLAGNRALAGTGSSGDSRGGGAVIAQNQAQLTLLNTTLNDNTTQVNGGAFHLRHRAVLNVAHTTIADSAAGGLGGLLYNDVVPNTVGDVHARFRASILGGGSCAGPAPASSLVSDGHNIETSGTCAFAATGDKPGVDAKLGALQANGALTATRLPALDSPAIDAAPATGCPATDQRGISRPQIGGCDIGAAEVEPPPAPPPAPPAPPPPPPPPPQVATAKLSDFFRFPSAKRCVSRRRFRIRLRVPKGVTVKEVRVFVNRKRVSVRRGSRITAPINLRGLPRGRFTVRIQIVLTDGRAISGQRKYRTCTRKRKSHRPPPV